MRSAALVTFSTTDSSDRNRNYLFVRDFNDIINTVRSKELFQVLSCRLRGLLINEDTPVLFF